MIQAIRSVNAGQRYISPEIAQQITLSQITTSTTENPFKALLIREIQITMITKGNKVQDIAKVLILVQNSQQLPLSVI